MAVFAEVISAMPLLHVTMNIVVGLPRDHQYVAKYRLKLDFPT